MAAKLHSRLGASNCKRWWACPGSVRMTADLPNQSTAYANEGSAAHALGEICLRTKQSPHFALDHWIHMDGRIQFGPDGIAEKDKNNVWFYVDEDMVDAVQTYVDFVNETVEPGDEVEIEQRVHLDQFHPDLFGTADLVIYKPAKKKLIVADYKHGRGVPVEVQDNVQGLYYAAGAAIRSHNRPLESIEVVIVQPRCAHKDGPVRRWSTTAMDLLDWVADLVEAAKRTESPEAPLHAGDHCKFCPAAGVCPEFKNAALEAAKADFTDGGDVVLTPPSRYTPQALAEALRNLDIIEDWCSAVRKFGHDEALAGRVAPGFKLVGTRATRKFRSEDEALKLATMLELDESEYMTEPKLKSVAQVEKALGKKGFKPFEGIVEKKSSGVVLVPVSDPREPMRPDAAGEFA
jgi:hypothetical protein